MARETFIAYKYSEAQDLRDLIIEKLGDDNNPYFVSAEFLKKVSEFIPDE